MNAEAPKAARRPQRHRRLSGAGGASYSDDALGRLTSSPLGGYSYGDAAHPDAATAIGSAWSASYDAVGDAQEIVHNCPLGGEGGGSQKSEIISRVYSKASEAFAEVVRQLGGVDDLTKQATFSAGQYKGLPNGLASQDRERSWRIDFDPNSSEWLHFNWIDSTGGAKGAGVCWGAVRMLGNAQTYDSMSDGLDGLLH